VSTTVVELEHWLEAMRSAAEELVSVALASHTYEYVPGRNDIPWKQTIGAYVPIVANNFSVHLGLLSSPDGCHSIARSLLNRPEDEKVSEEDMADAIREVVNILGGMTKTRIEGDIPRSTLGLPIFINGHVQITREQEAGLQMIKIGSTTCYLIALRQK